MEQPFLIVNTRKKQISLLLLGKENPVGFKVYFSFLR